MNQAEKFFFKYFGITEEATYCMFHVYNELLEKAVIFDILQLQESQIIKDKSFDTRYKNITYFLSSTQDSYMLKARRLFSTLHSNMAKDFINDLRADMESISKVNAVKKIDNLNAELIKIYPETIGKYQNIEFHVDDNSKYWRIYDEEIHEGEVESFRMERISLPYSDNVIKMLEVMSDLMLIFFQNTKNADLGWDPIDIEQLIDDMESLFKFRFSETNKNKIQAKYQKILNNWLSMSSAL